MVKLATGTQKQGRTSGHLLVCRQGPRTAAASQGCDVPLANLGLPQAPHLLWPLAAMRPGPPSCTPHRAYPRGLEKPQQGWEGKAFWLPLFSLLGALCPWAQLEGRQLPQPGRGLQQMWGQAPGPSHFSSA